MNLMYVYPETVFQRIPKHILEKGHITIANVENYCAQFMTEKMTPHGVTVDYHEVELDVVNDKSLLPNRVIQIYDVFSESGEMLNYHTNGSYLHNITYVSTGEDYDEDTLKINYKGLIVEGDTCKLLIPNEIIDAIVAYIELIELHDEYVSMKINPNIYKDLEMKAAGLISRAKNSIRKQLKSERSSIIRGSYFVPLGHLPLAHKMRGRD